MLLMFGGSSRKTPMAFVLPAFNIASLEVVFMQCFNIPLNTKRRNIFTFAFEQIWGVAIVESESLHHLVFRVLSWGHKLISLTIYIISHILTGTGVRKHSGVLNNVYKMFGINPFSPMSDQLQIYPRNIDT